MRDRQGLSVYAPATRAAAPLVARLRIPLIIVLVALIPIAALIAFDRTRNWTAIDIPAALAPTAMQAQGFTLNYPGTYVLFFEFRRSRPLQEMRCLLGIERRAPERCSGTPVLVHASWVLRRDGAVMEQGSTKERRVGFYAYPFVRSEIGRFEAGSLLGGRYSLEVTSAGDLSGLAEAQPRLKLQIHPRHNYDVIVLAILLLLFLPLPALGLWYFAGAVRDELAEKRAERAARR